MDSMFLQLLADQLGEMYAPAVQEVGRSRRAVSVEEGLDCRFEKRSS
jgi:hypothetical protein